MRFLDFIEQYDGVGLTAYGFRQLTAFIVSYISRRRSYQTGNTVLLLIFTHVDTRHHRFIVKQELGECLGKFRLTYAGRTEKEERADRAFRIL